MREEHGLGQECVKKGGSISSATPLGMRRSSHKSIKKEALLILHKEIMGDAFKTHLLGIGDRPHPILLET